MKQGDTMKEEISRLSSEGTLLKHDKMTQLT